MTTTTKGWMDMLSDYVFLCESEDLGRAGEVAATIIDLLRNTQRASEKNENHRIISSAKNGDIITEAFTWTAYCGHKDFLDCLVEHGINVNCFDSTGNTPLVCSCMQAHDVEIVRRLLDVGALVNISARCRSPLMWACFEGSLNIAELLLERNANPDHQEGSGWTALMLAAKHNHVDIVRLLLSYNCDVDVKTGKGLAALDLTSDEIKDLLRNHVNTTYLLK